MTHRPTLERWGTLLRSLFPQHAELDVKPRLGQLRAKWPRHRAVEIFIAPNAVEDYRVAGDQAKALADDNLIAFVKVNLSTLHPERAEAFRIVVASIDFVPVPRAH